MKLKVFTTSRQIRRWLENKNNEILDKHYTIKEFLEKIVVVDGKKFIDKDLRKKYLFEAIKNVDVERLGISKEFINFFEDSEFIFSFFKELFLEKVDINEVIVRDVYLDYEEHLKILREILRNYKRLLDDDEYIDEFLIKDYRINEGLLKDIDSIELRLDGYFPKFHMEILRKISEKIDIEVEFEVDKFNKNLLERSLGVSLKEDKKYIFNFKKLKEIKINKKNPHIEIEYFSDRLKQIEFVFAKIKEFVDSGIDPENIAVILPDENFKELLELFDEEENLNFAMGESFTKSNIYIKLKAIYDYLSGDSEAIKKVKDLIEEFYNLDLITFIKNYSTSKELEIIEEELFKLEHFKEMFDSKKEFLYFILDRFKDKKFDDVYSGKVTCMGVLESRGMEFDGVIIIDFNDEYVPNVSDSDLFLNTFVRKMAKLPTRFDKENLQKHYYYQLINNAKRVSISYTKNEESSPSKFLYELELDIGEKGDGKYEFFNFSKEKNLASYDDEFLIKYPIYPTTLKLLLECPKRYYFEKILNITSPSDEEFFGNIFHQAMEKLDKEENFTSSDEYYEKLIREIKSNIKDKKLLFDVMVNWEDKLKKFCKKDFELRANKKIKVEETVKFNYKGHELSCRIDRIDISDKEVILIDYKTSKSANKNEEYIFDFQTTFYYLWAKENFKDKDIKVYIWDIYTPDFIKSKEKVDLLDEVLENLPTRVKEAEDIVIEYEKNGEIKEKILKRARDICKYCPYMVSCGKDEG